MNILILGGGGREHSLAWAAMQNPKCDKLIVAPGNAGIAKIADCATLDIEDGAAVVGFAQAQAIDFVIVGPEAPLAAGVSDDLRAAGFLTFGPSKEAAQLEASKAFTKEICDAAKAPTARYGHFTNAKSAKAYVREHGAPIVVKADGLAAGKGVVVAMELDEALNAVDDMFGGAFGGAGAEVVIEEFMDGEEASFFILCDGKDVLSIGTAQDHKRVGAGDTGPNTGGMGAYSPAPVVTSSMHKTIMDTIIQPTLDGMIKDGIPYTGFLYAGVMIDAEGTPKVLEYNCRFGDPETQPIMMRLNSDLTDLCNAALDNKLNEITADWDSRMSVGVVLAAGGYPFDYNKGDIIRGIPAETSDAKVFHAGTKMLGNKLTTNGGRVLCACALGDSVQEAQAKAYEAVNAIDWDKVYFRTDIAYRAIEREKQS